MNLRSVSLVVALATMSALLAPLLPAVAAPTALPSRPAPPRTVPTRINDVDGDGRVDVVMLDAGKGQYGDVESEEEKAEDRIGGIRVLLADGKVQTVTRDHLGLPPFNDSRFGAALTVGDLNADGYADIVVADSSDGGYGGVVWAIWGSAKGISNKRVSVLGQQVRVAQLCPGRVGAVVDAGPAIVPFTLDPRCPGMLLGTVGLTAFTLLRRSTGGTVTASPPSSAAAWSWPAGRPQHAS